MDEKGIIRMGMSICVFLGLAFIPIYYYPGLHQAYHVLIAMDRGTEFWLGWTVYHPQGFGGIHVPTAILFFLIAMAALMTPAVVLVLNKLSELVAIRLARKKENE